MQRALLNSINAKVSGDVPLLEKRINEMKKKFDDINPKARESLNIVQISAVAAFISGIAFVLLGFTSVGLLNPIESLIGQASMIVFPFSLIALLIGSIEYAFRAHKRNSCSNELNELHKVLEGSLRTMTMIKSEISKLKIDKISENLNYNDYEEYLRKTYG